jgi:FtsP/CotA-like multicopper oxidase with cupredoxin domain
LINTLVEPHPIHFHLVNFQLVQTYTLRMVQDECSQYEVDFLRTSGFSKFAALTDGQLCDYIGNSITGSEAEIVFHGFNSLYLENQTLTTPNGKISGFNVLELVTPLNRVVDPNCPLSSTYKYLCQETTPSIPQHYRRWKDTALISPYSVSVLRIRWTMTEYDEKVQAYPYFKIPEDQLMEFPGFVYHCHILPHEDNEMMRPYMLQPSDAYLTTLAVKLKAQGTTYNQSSLAYSWSDKQLKINKKLGCNSYV